MVAAGRALRHRRGRAVGPGPRHQRAASRNTCDAHRPGISRRPRRAGRRRGLWSEVGRPSVPKTRCAGAAASAKWRAGRGGLPPRRELPHHRRPGRAEPAHRALDALRAADVQVVVRQADVARVEDVAQLLAHIAAHLPALRGMVHAAGLLEDGTLRQIGADRPGPRAGPQGRERLAPAPAYRRVGAGLFRQMFLLHLVAGHAGPGHARRAPARAGATCAEHRLGRLGDIGATACKDAHERLDAHGGGTLSPAQGLEALNWAGLTGRGRHRPLMADLAPAAGAEPTRRRDGDRGRLAGADAGRFPGPPARAAGRTRARRERAW